MSENLLIVISGPSGVGKNTIISNLFERLPKLTYSISATTRAPREGEVDGANYFFLTKEDFEQKIERNEFLEWAQVYQYYYGTPKKAIFDKLESGFDVIMDVDVQGALQIKKAYDKALLIFLAPPSLKTLKERLIGRHTESEEQVMERLKYISTEFEYATKYDYFIINDEINLTGERIEGIIQSERYRTARLDSKQIEKILNEI